ncbi:hypothetical protein BJ684DRAFT_15656, partial [Piptocephalis cylindrospora]
MTLRSKKGQARPEHRPNPPHSPITTRRFLANHSAAIAPLSPGHSGGEGRVLVTTGIRAQSSRVSSGKKGRIGGKRSWRNHPPPPPPPPLPPPSMIASGPIHGEEGIGSWDSIESGGGVGMKESGSRPGPSLVTPIHSGNSTTTDHSISSVEVLESSSDTPGPSPTPQSGSGSGGKSSGFHGCGKDRRKTWNLLGRGRHRMAKLEVKEGIKSGGQLGKAFPEEEGGFSKTAFPQSFPFYPSFPGSSKLGSL